MKKSSVVIVKGLIMAIVAGVLLCVPPAYGQVVTASIVRTVTDSFGAVVPAAGTQGNVGNYVQQGPGFFALNAAISRTIKLTERFKLLVRSEWLNASNTPQFSSPGTTLGSSSFGLVTSATGQRVVDLVGKLIF